MKKPKIFHEDEDFSSEEEFLAHYDPNEFERLSLTADIAIFSVSDRKDANYRKSTHKNFSILLVKRQTYPFMDKWCLPGGFIQMGEDLDTAARRILRQETNVKDIYLEQLYTFSNPQRDPRMRIISSAHLALIDKNLLTYRLNNETAWFDLSITEDTHTITIHFTHPSEHFTVVLEKVTSLYGRTQYKVVSNDRLAFDHAEIIAMGINRLKNKIEYTDIVFHMMPKYFTLGELQRVYETILNRKLLDPAFRRMIANRVIKTDQVKKGGGHRPSALYQYKGEITND